MPEQIPAFFYFIPSIKYYSYLNDFAGLMRAVRSA